MNLIIHLDTFVQPDSVIREEVQALVEPRTDCVPSIVRTPDYDGSVRITTYHRALPSTASEFIAELANDQLFPLWALNHLRSTELQRPACRMHLRFFDFLDEPVQNMPDRTRFSIVGPGCRFHGVLTTGRHRYIRRPFTTLDLIARHRIGDALVRNLDLIDHASLANEYGNAVLALAI